MASVAPVDDDEVELVQRLRAGDEGAFDYVVRTYGRRLLTLWANLHLLFWLSLVPFVTAWMGENHFAELPVALYGIVMLMAGVAYFILSRVLVSRHGPDSPLARAVGADRKGLVSVLIYIVAVAVSFVSANAAMVLYVAVAVMWLIPDRRIERILANDHH